MSDEGFLKRWSRRKRSETPAADAPDSAKPPPRESAAEATPDKAPAIPPVAAAPAAKEEEAIDPATLPPLESLGPDSDYSVFLRKGVPEALRLAALRKAWASDPFIRDFRSPAIDYGWDFTTPDYALRPGDDVGKLLDQIFPPGAREPAQPEAAAATAAAEPQPPRKEAAAPTAPGPLPLAEAVPPAEQPRPQAERQTPVQRRKHGGALPGDPD